jgi:antirestriction protein ArdC
VYSRIKETMRVSPSSLDGFLACSGASIREGHGEAYYAPGADFIMLPRFEAFKSAAHFYDRFPRTRTLVSMQKSAMGKLDSSHCLVKLTLQGRPPCREPVPFEPSSRPIMG